MELTDRNEKPMTTSRTGPLAITLAMTLAVATLTVVSSRSHEQDVPVVKNRLLSPGPGRDAIVNVPKGAIGLEISLGLKDDRRTEWSGEITVSEGKVLSLEVTRSAVGASVSGPRFKVESKKQVAKKKKKAAGAVGPVLQATLDTPEDATITVHTGQGNFSFKASDLAKGQRRPFLDGEATVERLEAAVRLTGAGTEDDFPAAAKSDDGTVWLAYVEYHPENPRLDTTVKDEDFDTLVPKKHGDRIRLRKFDQGKWQPGIDVTDGGLDVWRPTVAVDGKGTVWVAWAQQVDGDWEIYRRGYTPGKVGGEGSLTPVTRVTNAKGSDFHVVAASNRGTVWLAWQGFRDGNYEILAAKFDDPQPRVVSSSKANDWSPAIAADGRGGVFVAWDTYDAGNYDVMLRDISHDAATIPVAHSAKFEGRASVACDRSGRVWVGYEEGDEQWGKDFAHEGAVTNVGLEKNLGYALYVNRTVRLKCLVDGRLSTLAEGSQPKFGPLGDRNKSLPRLAFDASGGMWLLARHHPLPGGAGEVWVSSAFRFDGKNWSRPRRLSSSANLIDNRPAVIPDDNGILVIHSTDHRQNAQTRVEDDLYVTRLGAESATTDFTLAADLPPSAAAVASVHPDEAAAISRLRSFRLDFEGKTLRPLRGEFHRHTEVSSHRDQDGLLEDSWRYGLDAASHDWMGNGDHDNGHGFEYLWWIIQKSADLHHNPPYFVGAQTYERSVVYPNGHRNVMMPKRGIRPLPRGNVTGTFEEGTPDTKLLYRYLKHFEGICASHTSATNMGTDWRDNDPTVEPVVEIFQGHRHNYEHFGAPRSPTEATQIGGYQPKGFVWNALEKGYRLGFESSSDHVSTHLSYAVVFAEDTSRAAIIDAFKRRHCYAATDNILLDVRSGPHMMGDTFTATGKPGLKIKVRGTSPVARVHIIRDNKYAFTTEPGTAEVALNYTDDEAKAGETHYYYVRVEQKDGNLAWGSPVWITIEKSIRP